MDGWGCNPGAILFFFFVYFLFEIFPFYVPEEVFSGKTALWLSPDGKKLAYVRFDDSPVRRINIPIYGIPGAPDFQYPAELPVNYPKVYYICELFEYYN